VVHTHVRTLAVMIMTYVDVDVNTGRCGLRRRISAGASSHAIRRHSQQQPQQPRCCTRCGGGAQEYVCITSRLHVCDLFYLTVCYKSLLRGLNIKKSPGLIRVYRYDFPTSCVCVYMCVFLRSSITLLCQHHCGRLRLVTSRLLRLHVRQAGDANRLRSVLV